MAASSIAAFFGKPADEEDHTDWWSCDGECGMWYSPGHEAKVCDYRCHTEAKGEDNACSYGQFCSDCWATQPSCGITAGEFDCSDCRDKEQMPSYKKWWAIVGPHWPSDNKDRDYQCAWFKEAAAKPASKYPPGSALDLISKRPNGQPAKEPKAKPAKRAWAVGSGEPTAEDYRLPADDIRADLCQARVLLDSDWDDRYSPRVFPENQCRRKPAKDSEFGLCSLCDKHRERVCGDGLDATEMVPNKIHYWCGLITAEPPGYVHMLGNAWHEEVVAGHGRKALTFKDE